MITKNYYLINDENTVITNPHKGFYYHYVDNGFFRPNYRDEADLETKLPSFPGMHHIYIRFDWSDVEKEEGVYDWSCIDEIIEKWKKYGFKFSFRLCTYEGVGTDIFAFPKWLFDMGINCTALKDEKSGSVSYEPDYGDPLFLEKLENFMAEFGRKFDGDPDVEYMDIGSFGTWGEAHTSGGSLKTFSPDVLRKHIDIYLKYFKKTPLFVNDDMFTHASYTSEEAVEPLVEYCISKGIGIRDDGICVEYYSRTFGYHTLRQPDLFEKFTKYAPCNIELDHWFRIEADHFKSGLPYIESLRKSKATYTGFHGYVEGWLEKNRDITNYIANRLGYWYFIRGIEYVGFTAGCRELVGVKIENMGFSRAYHKYDLKFYAVGENKTYELNEEAPDNRAWDGGTAYTVPIMFDFTNIPSGSYKLKVKMCYGKTPIKLGFKNELMTEDGGYIIDDITVAEL